MMGGPGSGLDFVTPIDPHTMDPTINLTNNQTDHMDHLQISVSYMCKTVVFLTIILVAIFSNLLVIASVFLYRKLRGINNYFLVSLAFADLFVACFAMTFNASQELFGRWMFGPAACDVYNSIDVHASTVSTLHLCCISVDRYFAIIKPFDYRHYMNPRSVTAMIVAAWLCPCLISFVPILLGWSGESDIQEMGDVAKCVFTPNIPYAIFSSFLTFWLPMTCMILVYYRVYREAVKQKNAMAMTTNIHLPPTNGDSSLQRKLPLHDVAELQKEEMKCSQDLQISTPEIGTTTPDIRTSTPDESENRSRSESQSCARGVRDRISLGTIIVDARMRARSSVFVTSGVSILEVIKERRRMNSSWRKEHKAFVTLGVVMGAFLICWLPFFLWYLTVTICGEACPCPHSVVVTLFWIGYFNSTLNPVIYVMTNRDFKSAFIGILKRLFCSCCPEGESRRQSNDS